MEETKAPTGYILPTNNVTRFTLSAEHPVVELTITNSKSSGGSGGGGGGGGTMPTIPTNPTDPTSPTTPNVAPPIVTPGHTVVPTDPRTYIEYDENGTPLGTWHLNDDNIWVFDTEIPLAALAKTGDSRTIEWMLLLSACLSMFGVVIFTRTRKKRDED